MRKKINHVKTTSGPKMNGGTQTDNWFEISNKISNAQAMDRHKTMLERLEKASTQPLGSERSIGPLKLTRGVLLLLKHHVVKEFFRLAAPTAEEKRCIEFKGAVREVLVVENARTYAKAICWAVGEFADSLTQVVTGRTRRPSMSDAARRAVWEESLRFADELATEGLWSTWLDNGNFPVSHDSESVWTDQDRQKLFQRVRLSRTEWLFEADRRITHRLILCGAKPGLKRVEQRRREVAKLMFEYPQSSAHDLCVRIDSLNEAAESRKNEIPCPVPDFLKRFGLRLWGDAFGGGRPEITQKMHEYLSKIRKQFGLSKPPNLPPA